MQHLTSTVCFPKFPNFTVANHSKSLLGLIWCKKFAYSSFKAFCVLHLVPNQRKRPGATKLCTPYLLGNDLSSNESQFVTPPGQVATQINERKKRKEAFFNLQLCMTIQISPILQFSKDLQILKSVTQTKSTTLWAVCVTSFFFCSNLMECDVPYNFSLFAVSCGIALLVACSTWLSLIYTNAKQSRTVTNTASLHKKVVMYSATCSIDVNV